MSPGGIALIAPVVGQPGERVIAYVDHLGRLEGHIARVFQNGFAMTIAATTRKRDKLAAQLTWLANRHILGLPEDRRHGRVVPRNPVGRLILPNGLNLTCRIIDVSQSGAGVATDQARLSAHWSRSARCRGAWCAIWKTASPSSSSACSIPTSSKRTSPAFEAAFRFPRDGRHQDRPRASVSPPAHPPPRDRWRSRTPAPGTYSAWSCSRAARGLR